MIAGYAGGLRMSYSINGKPAAIYNGRDVVFDGSPRMHAGSLALT